MSDRALTKDEKAVIASLKRLAKRWPRTLTLAFMDGELVVFRTGDPLFLSDDDRREESVIADIPGIPNTGGAW